MVNVTAFDQPNDVFELGSNRRFLISKLDEGYETSQHDQCRYKLKVITDDNVSITYTLQQYVMCIKCWLIRYIFVSSMVINEMLIRYCRCLVTAPSRVG